VEFSTNGRGERGYSEPRVRYNGEMFGRDLADPEILWEAWKKRPLFLHVQDGFGIYLPTGRILTSKMGLLWCFGYRGIIPADAYYPCLNGYRGVARAPPLPVSCAGSER